MKRKQLLINEKEFNDLKRSWRGGLFSLCSDSLFIRALIEHELTSKSEKKKEKRTISLVCNRCGEPFKLNVIFDENGECNNILSRFCSKCINILYDEKQKGFAPDDK